MTHLTNNTPRVFASLCLGQTDEINFILSVSLVVFSWSKTPREKLIQCPGPTNIVVWLETPEAISNLGTLCTQSVALLEKWMPSRTASICCLPEQASTKVKMSFSFFILSLILKNINIVLIGLKDVERSQSTRILTVMSQIRGVGAAYVLLFHFLDNFLLQ